MGPDKNQKRVSVK